MVVMDTRNMWSNFAVNNYLHTIASCWILLIHCTIKLYTLTILSRYQDNSVLQY